MNTVIGIPTRGLISLGTAEFLRKQKYDIYYAPSMISVVNARQMIVSHFIDSEYDSLLFLDDDVCPEKDIVEKLYAHDKDIISANYPIYKDGSIKSSAYSVQKEDYHPYTFDEMGLKKIDATGLGCCLIKRKVFMELGIEFRIKYDGAVIRIGEDIDFCNRARRSGFDIYCDFYQVCDHYKNVSLKTIWDKYCV